MKTHDFWYDLPEELIAQTPLERRDSSRLLVLDRRTGALEHRHFYDIIDYLNPGDCLVMNDSRALPARLLGQRPTGGAVGGSAVAGSGRRSLGVPGEAGPENAAGPGGELRRWSPHRHGDPGAGGRKPGGAVSLSGNFPGDSGAPGKMPLPPYIQEELQDQERYQTVYSRSLGSAAAPTAGLHFTRELLDRIRQKGISEAFVTLHVGLGTFRPVKAEEVTEHHMHSELGMLSQETADLLNATRQRGGRIACVGTTSCRTLESLVGEDGSFCPGSKWTDIFIYPGYRFRAMDALITNFHLPESTLVMLVSAFAGREHVLTAYREAVREWYRFFSFGDAMFIANEA